jgi:hypothetical protein
MDAGATINPYKVTTMGPFPWTPDAGGHKCLLAAIQAAGQHAVSQVLSDGGVWLPPAYQSNMVAQRNLQIPGGSTCAYNISNSSGADVDLSLGVSVTPSTPAPGSAGGPDITLTFGDLSGAWYAQWVLQGLTVATADGQTTVNLQASDVALNTVILPAGVDPPPQVTIHLASGPAATVALSSTLTTIAGPETDAGAQILLQNGGSCQLTTPVGCPSGLTPCGTTCTNLDLDNANCGQCGIACISDATCSGGICMPQIH